MIFFVIQLTLFFKRLSPFKKDKPANDSLFYIFMISKYYFSDYTSFHVEDKDDFSKKLWQVANVYDVRRMQDKTHRIRFQALLHKHSNLLEEAYELFIRLNYTPSLKRVDVELVVERTHQILNQIILDINEEFKEQEKPAA